MSRNLSAGRLSGLGAPGAGWSWVLRCGIAVLAVAVGGGRAAAEQPTADVVAAS